jgi:hypothetical protein
MVFGGQILGSDSPQETDICVSLGRVDREGCKGFPNSLLISQ